MSAPDTITLTITSAEVSRDPTLDAFVKYYHSTKRGVSNPSSPSSDAGRTQGGDAYLRSLIKLLADELEKARALSDGGFTDLVGALTHLRAESDITDVYKGRIVDLQKVINGTKLPGELDALIGRQDIVVPTEADPTPFQREREAVHGVSRLAGRVTDMNERLRAQNAMLGTQVAGLLSENALLMDRIALLEEQVSALGNSAAVASRALNKARAGGCAHGSSDAPARTVRGQETIVAGVPMDRETALWLKDVYAQLSNGGAVEDVIRNLSRGAVSKAPPRVGSSVRKDLSLSRGSTPFSQFVEGNRSLNATGSLNGPQ